MSDPRAVTIPLLNPNEPEALLAALHVHEGQLVREGDLLCTLETTKSTAELQADAGGYVTRLRLQAGMTVPAGEILCYLAETVDAVLPGSAEPASTGQFSAAPPAAETLPEGLRISQPALALARQAGLDLSQFCGGAFVTEQMVRAAIQARPTQTHSPAEDFSLPPALFDASAILVYGGGGHGKAVIDLIRRMGVYTVAGIVDDGIAPGTTIMGVKVLGGGEILPQLASQGLRLAANAVGGIGNVAVRIRIFQRLGEAGFAFPVLIHPSAVVEPSAAIAAGVHIFPLAYVGSESRLEFGCIVNTRALVSHDCHIEAYANLSPGAILAGQVHVGSAALVGMGANINLMVKIGLQAKLGNGAIIKSDVPDHGIVRAGGVWPS